MLNYELDQIDIIGVHGNVLRESVEVVTVVGASAARANAQ